MSPIETLRQSFLSPEREDPHWREDLSNEAYHALKTHVSSSSLRKFPKSGKSFLWSFNSADEPTELKDFGTAFHQAALEPDQFEKLHAVMPREFIDPETGLPFVNPKTGEPLHANAKKVQEAKKAWLEENQGRTILTQKRFDEMRWMMDSLASHPNALKLLKKGIAERSGFFHDRETGMPCRIRPDSYNTRYNAIIDIKTTSKDISWNAYSRTLWKERFDISLAMYADGTEIITGTPVSATVIIAVQTVKPYECAVYEISKRTMSIGHMDYKTALSDLAEALRTNRWSSAQARMQEIEHPSSVFKEYVI